jgi:molybdopterin converting factor small subunit
MKVVIRLFARARDLVGEGVIEIELPAGATIEDLRRQLETEHPTLKPLLEKSALALNDEFADDSSRIPLEAEIALLPPVSGG